jgi:hypothetical protein
MADLTTAEGVLRELWDVRSNKSQLTPEQVRTRQKTAWQAARKILGVKAKDKGAGGASDED